MVCAALHAGPNQNVEVSGSCDGAVSLVRGVLRAALLLPHPSAGVRIVSGRTARSPRRPRPRGAHHRLRPRRQLLTVALSGKTSFLPALLGLPASVGSISQTLGPKNRGHGRTLLLQMLPGFQR